MFAFTQTSAPREAPSLNSLCAAHPIPVRTAREAKAMSSKQEKAAGNNGSNAIAVQRDSWSDISIQCYEKEVPPFVGAALERLYGNLFSSLAYYRAFGGADQASSYVVRDGKAIVCLWLFHRHRNAVRVINEGIRLEQDELMRFASYIFSRYPAVNLISFHAVRPQLADLPLPHQRFNCLEDMVLTLPSSADAYLASLGRSTRSYIHRYLNKLKRDFPTFRFRALAAGDIEAGDVRRIIGLNRLRMASKGAESRNDDDTMRRIERLAGECGLMGVIMLDGRICAGSINYRVGANYFLETLAHDSAYDDYRLGTLCCFLTICECIERGGNEYHFLWGQDEYKTRLLGVQRDLDDLVIYRSRLHMLLYGKLVLQHAVNGLVRRLRIWVRRTRRKNTFGGRLMQRLWRLTRGHSRVTG
jgi:hypothetical protein